jgi:hypothetical protein
MPETRVETTGSPVTIASISATGMPSIMPAAVTTLGSAITSERSRSCRT